MKRVPPAGPAELVAFETDVLAGFVLVRAAAGLADVTIRSDVSHLEQLRAWFGRAAVGTWSPRYEAKPKVEVNRGAPGGVFCREPGCCLGPEAGERLRRAGRTRLPGACLTGCTPNDALVPWCGGLALVRAAAGVATGASGADGSGTARKYSNSRGRGGLAGTGRTVTCRDGRGRTCCRQMACKRSAVRARLAPLVRSKIRTGRAVSTAGKYSNGGPLGRRTCSDRASSRGWGFRQDTGFQALNRRWPACHLGESRFIGSVTLATWSPLGPRRGTSARDCCRICRRSGRAGVLALDHKRQPWWC